MYESREKKDRLTNRLFRILWHEMKCARDLLYGWEMRPRVINQTGHQVHFLDFEFLMTGKLAVCIYRQIYEPLTNIVERGLRTRSSQNRQYRCPVWSSVTHLTPQNPKHRGKVYAWRNHSSEHRWHPAKLIRYNRDRSLCDRRVDLTPLTWRENSADTGRWSLIVISGWLVYDSCCITVEGVDRCRMRSVHAGFRLWNSLKFYFDEK